jgi:hypothetical protein
MFRAWGNKTSPKRNPQGKKIIRKGWKGRIKRVYLLDSCKKVTKRQLTRECGGAMGAPSKNKGGTEVGVHEDDGSAKESDDE